MIHIFKGFSIGLMLLMAGCISAPMQIAGLKFVNETGLPVSDVELRVMKTFEVASCSYILAGSEFSTQFPLLDYRGNEIEVRWKDRSGEYRFGPKRISAPDPIPARPVTAVILLRSDGRASAEFRED